MTSRYTAFQLRQLLARELNKVSFLDWLGDLPSLMKLHQEEAMVPAQRAADPLNCSIVLFPTFSHPMLVPRPSRSCALCRPRKAKIGLHRL